MSSLEEKQEPLEVRHALLNASLKLFLLRAPEMQLVLGRLFSAILNDPNEDIDLKDRAAYYYRSLQSGLPEVKQALSATGLTIDKFLEEEEIKNESKAIEFNTLAAVY